MWRRPEHPEGWRQVTAPGGYEVWRFEARLEEGITHVVAELSQGSLVNTGYVSAYHRFRRRPHRHPPPLPEHLSCTFLAVYRDGRSVGRFASEHGPTEFAASTKSPEVRIGPARVFGDGDALVLELLDPQRTGNTRFSRDEPAESPQGRRSTVVARLRFVPEWPHEHTPQRFLPGCVGEHFWIPGALRCRVEGELKIGEGGTEIVSGVGVFEKRFGTAPLGEGIDLRMHLRAFADHSASIVYLSRGSGGTRGEECRLFESGPRGLHEVEMARPPQIEWIRGSRWRLVYPHTADFGRSLRLMDPQIVDSSPGQLRLVYGAEVDGRQTTALCEIVSPRRHHHPMLRRLGVVFGFGR